MQRKILNLAGVSDAQRARYRTLLETHRIAFHETPASLISWGDLWVIDPADFERAKALVDAETAAIAAEAGSAHAREYAERFGGSYWRWFLGRIREEPGRVLQILALAVFIWFGVVYWFVK